MLCQRCGAAWPRQGLGPTEEGPAPFTCARMPKVRAGPAKLVAQPPTCLVVTHDTAAGGSVRRLSLRAASCSSHLSKRVGTLNFLRRPARMLLHRPVPSAIAVPHMLLRQSSDIFGALMILGLL